MWAFSLARRLNDNLNFWNISSNSLSGGGLALMDSIPSPRSFFLDFLLRLLFSSSRKAAAACWRRAINFSMSSKQRLRMFTSFSYLSLEVELVSSNFSLFIPPSSWACIRGDGCNEMFVNQSKIFFEKTFPLPVIHHRRARCYWVLSHLGTFEGSCRLDGTCQP